MKKFGRIVARKAIGAMVLVAIGGGWVLYKQEKDKNGALRAALKMANETMDMQNKVIRELNKGKEVDPE